MKIKKGHQAGITGPLLNDLVVRDKARQQQTAEKLDQVTAEPLSQPDLYQDSGSGYNVNFVFPQD